MLASQLAPAMEYPCVQRFVVDVLDMQFSDVRAMLQLPRPDIGIKPACNFAIVSTLCNLISGISTTIFKPKQLLTEIQSTCPSGQTFTALVRDHFPYCPTGTSDFPRQLYDLCRNPMAHSAGLIGAPAPVVVFTRIFDQAHSDVGWSDRELEDIEHPDRSFELPYKGIVTDLNRWTLHCDSFYLDVIAILRHLNTDSTQMQAAERRFSKGVYNWRR